MDCDCTDSEPAELWLSIEIIRARRKLRTLIDPTLVYPVCKLPPDVFTTGLVGSDRVTIDRSGGYQPDDCGEWAYITPVFVHHSLIDLVAWHPATPDAWALRIGSGLCLGDTSTRFDDEFRPECAVRAYRSPYSWLMNWSRAWGSAGGIGGVCVLSRDPADVYLVLGSADRIIAEDTEHRKELRAALARPIRVPIVVTE